MRIEAHYKAGRCRPVPFRVRFLEGQGVSVDLSEKVKKESKQHEALNQHLEQTEQRRQAKGWQGEGIIDHFLRDVRFWNTHFFFYEEEQ